MKWGRSESKKTIEDGFKIIQAEMLAQTRGRAATSWINPESTVNRTVAIRWVGCERNNGGKDESTGFFPELWEEWSCHRPTREH